MSYKLGFTTGTDLLTTLIAPSKIVWITGLVTSLTIFIEKYVYASADAIYFLFFLLAVDFITGVCKSIFINKDFSSKKFPRSMVSAVVYSLIFIISTGAAYHSLWFIWLPNFVYGVLLSTIIISIFENLTQLKLIDAKILTIIKNKVSESLKLNK